MFHKRNPSNSPKTNNITHGATISEEVDFQAPTSMMYLEAAVAETSVYSNFKNALRNPQSSRFDRISLLLALLDHVKPDDEFFTKFLRDNKDDMNSIATIDKRINIEKIEL
jgi:hypothetical protein